jgi:ABC-type dipeptide/oligopeptide/nickel transport system permease subunit
MGIIIPEREWIWWVFIPSLFMVWVIMNWKIVKDKK